MHQTGAVTVKFNGYNPHLHPKLPTPNGKKKKDVISSRAGRQYATRKAT
jgi:hypothetical protein